MRRHPSQLRVLQYIIMPDHLHLLLRVMEYLDDPLGVHISKLKIKSLQMARASGIYAQSIFEKNFHDRFLRKDHSLDVIFRYIRQNPYRLLVRRLYPDYWMYAAANGGVLVSPFISGKEKEIRDNAEAEGSKIILISNEAFGERYKPGGKNFQMCEEGRMLIVSPRQTLPGSRNTYLLLNSLAEWLAYGIAPTH